MSLNRFNPRRDENEPEIRKRFATHGWHTEQVSGTGMPDLLAFNLRVGTHSVRLVDVKMPKGKVKPAQEMKWKALHDKGIPVYVVRTKADVDALVRGELPPWAPDEKPSLLRALGMRRMPRRSRRDMENGAAYTPPRGMSAPDHGQKRTKACGCPRALGRCEHSGPYAPRGMGHAVESLASDESRIKAATKAAREAEETFAPAVQCAAPGCVHEVPCPRHGLYLLGKRP